MVVGMEGGPSFGLVGPSFGTVGELELEAPRFAAEYEPSDLCSDEGSTTDEIRISCITGPGARTTKMVVVRDGSGLTVITGDKQTRWTPPESWSSKCFELHGLAGRRDLELLRKSWMLDEPKCQRDPSRAASKLTLRVEPLVTPGSSGGDRGHAKVTLLGAGQPRLLGSLSNMSGAVSFSRWSALNGVEVQASDMGSERRFVYQLGDRVFYVADDGRIHSAELPCGARASFDVGATGQLRISEHAR